MSWLFGGGGASGGVAAFDELLDKATSELVPVGQDEILLNGLQLSDMVRSKAIEAEPALKSVRRRIGHKNPNVQVQALHVLDLLVKNSGSAFLLAVGSRKDGWLDQLEALCRASNNEVRAAATRNLQNWALAFKSSNTSAALSTADLVYLHTRLRYENVIEFPPISNEMNASMISSLSAPEWVDDDACQRCRTSFTVTNRKHHCRNCGGVFCGDCSSKKMKLGHLGIEQEVRVCDGCEKKLSDSSRRSNSVSKPTINGQRAAGSTGMMSGKSQEELDFEQAIAMSLAESGSAVQHNALGSAQANGTNTLPGVGYGYEPRPSQPPTTASGASDTASLMPSKQLESEDPDLAAAIRASLAEVAAAQQHQPIATTSSAPYHASAPPTSSYSYTPQQPVAVPSVPSYELAMAEFDALDSFSNALARNAQHIAPDDANELFYRADRHRGKMMRAMQDADVKGQTLFELNQKLQRAVRLYDSLLERSIGQYQRPMNNAYQGAPQYQQMPYNPTQQEYYQRPQSQYDGPQSVHAAHASPQAAARQSQVYAGPPGQPRLHRAPSSSYHAQQQSTYTGPHYEQPHDTTTNTYAEQHPQTYETQAHFHDGRYQQEGAHVPHDAEQYYHAQPHDQAQQELEQPYAQAAYPASAYPYPEQHQSSAPYPLASPPTEQPPYGAIDDRGQSMYKSPERHATALPDQTASTASAPYNDRNQPEQGRELYDEHGNKLRLQGYYKPSSFPAAPSGPVGGLAALPDAPTGELQHVASQYDQPNGRQERKQEEALIDF